MTTRIGERFGNYQLLRVLGQGSFADVYLGEHIHLKSFAAIKILYARLTSELQENFLTEARILAQLSHPHIIHILDFGTEEGVPYLIMEYAPHGSLRQRHPRNSILPLPTVVDYVKQIADGLQYAHEKKLVHRDLKPDNILIGQREELLISDFGVALIAQTTHSSHNVEEGFAGTATYMAPEQLRGRPQFASDQYALGIMAYEWLCGTRPFQGTIIELYSQHQSVPPTPLSQLSPTLPPAVEQVVLKALEKEPDKRFPDVKAFAAALEQAHLLSQTEDGAQPTLPPSTSAIPVSDGPTTPLPITPPLQAPPPPPSASMQTDSAAPFSLASQTRTVSAMPRKMIPLVGLVLLLILGALLATTLYNANNSKQKQANLKPSPTVPLPGTPTNAPIPTVSSTPGTPTGTNTPTQADTINVTPTTNSGVSTSAPTPQPSPTATPTKVVTPTPTPTPKPSPTPIPCSAGATTSTPVYQGNGYAYSNGGTFRAASGHCNGRVYFAFSSAPSVTNTQVRACTASGTCGSWVKYTAVGSKLMLMKGLANGTSFHLQFQGYGATASYKVSGTLYY
jgi:serine/threonine protein kinase